MKMSPIAIIPNNKKRTGTKCPFKCWSIYKDDIWFLDWFLIF